MGLRRRRGQSVAGGSDPSEGLARPRLVLRDSICVLADKRGDFFAKSSAGFDRGETRSGLALRIGFGRPDDFNDPRFPIRQDD